MKKIVFRRKTLGGAIRVFVYEQSEDDFQEGGSKREFFHTSGSPENRPPVGHGRIHLYNSWGISP